MRTPVVRSWKHVLAAVGGGALVLGLLMVGPTSSLAQGSAKADRGLHPFTIVSDSFRDGDFLPVGTEGGPASLTGCSGQNLAPELSWFNVPVGTQGFAFTINDVDAPVAGGFHHWVVYNIPANVRELEGRGSNPFGEGTNSYGFVGYGGPCPPADGQPHHYIFTVYALAPAPTLATGITYEQLLASIAPDVKGATSIVGKFRLPLSR